MEVLKDKIISVYSKLDDAIISESETSKILSKKFEEHSHKELYSALDHGHDIENITDLQTELNQKENISNRGLANGYATLDENTKIPISQIPDAILGQMTQAGSVDATTGIATLTTNGKQIMGTTDNTITLTNNTLPVTGYSDNEGNYYIVSKVGTLFGIEFKEGDWLISNASGWSKISNTDAVTTVAGRIGDVILTKSDVGLENVNNTSDANKPVSTATQTALNLKQDKISAGTSGKLRTSSGTAGTVNELSSTVGSSTRRPVYINSGTPAQVGQDMAYLSDVQSAVWFAARLMSFNSSVIMHSPAINETIISDFFIDVSNTVKDTFYLRAPSVGKFDITVMAIRGIQGTVSAFGGGIEYNIMASSSSSVVSKTLKSVNADANILSITRVSDSSAGTIMGIYMIKRIS